MKVFSGYVPSKAGHLPRATAFPAMGQLKEAVFVASERPVGFGSAQWCRVESYTWHQSRVEIEAGFQHLTLLRVFSFPVGCLQGVLQDLSALD